MNKKVLTFFMLTLFILGPISILQGQEEASYAMWESMYITPDNTKLKALGEAMSKHNKKYHKEGPYMATVYNVVTGPNMGKLVWQMGPLNYSHLDDRPSDGGHDDDWRDNVMPNVKKLSSGEYWRQNNEASNTSMIVEGDNPYPILHIRFHEVNRGQSSQVKHLMGVIGSTVKAMDGVNPWGLYINEFQQGYKIGRHIASVGFYKNWAEYDKEDTFQATYEKLHGEDSWQSFLDGIENTFSNSWDEIWERNAAMSGN